MAVRQCARDEPPGLVAVHRMEAVGRSKSSLGDPELSTTSDDHSVAAERRTTPRFKCQGSISIRQQQTRFPVGAAVTDISLNGCYVELLTTLPVGTKVDLLLQVAEITVHCAGEVVTSHPGVGMGIKFEQMSETDRGALENAIARVSSST